MEGGDQSCIECEVESVAWVRVVGLAVAVVVACLLLVAAYLCYRTMAARGAKKDAGALRSVLHSAAHGWINIHPLRPMICIHDSMYRWVKPNFVSGGAVPLSIYGKVSNFVCHSCTSQH
jgi:hypothetical protein